MEIKCAEGVIDIISANYGRLSKTECTRKQGIPISYATTNCRHSNSMDALKKRCNKQKQCSIKIFKEIGPDPCVGIEKYMEAEFQCIITSK